MRPGGIYKGLVFVVILIGAIALFSLLFPGTSKPEVIPLSDAITMSQQNEIKKIVIEDEAIIITTTEDAEFKTRHILACRRNRWGS